MLVEGYGAASAMPNMRAVLSPREIRDLVAKPGLPNFHLIVLSENPDKQLQELTAPKHCSLIEFNDPKGLRLAFGKAKQQMVQRLTIVESDQVRHGKGGQIIHTTEKKVLMDSPGKGGGKGKGKGGKGKGKGGMVLMHSPGKGGGKGKGKGKGYGAWYKPKAYGRGRGYSPY